MKTLAPLNDYIVIETIKEKQDSIIITAEPVKVHYMIVAVDDKETVLEPGDEVLLNSVSMLALDKSFGDNLYITSRNNIIGVVNDE